MSKNWRDFFEARNDADFINPFWHDINLSVKDISSHSLSLDEISSLIDSRKLTGYFNRQVTPRSNWKDYFDDKKSKDFLEFEIAYRALRELNIHNQYFKQISNLGWAPSLVTARHFFYASFVKKRFSYFGVKPIKILEIGGGSGALSIFLRQFFEVKDYFDVDFSEMCLVNYSQYLNYFESNSQAKILYKFYNNADKFSSISSDSKNIVYSEPGFFLKNFRKLGKFDLIINTHSFQEMDKTIRDRYCDICSALLSKNGRFMNVNTEQKMSNKDGSIYKNTPLTYQYPPTVEIDYMDEDPLLKRMRLTSNHKNVKLSYITIIRKNPYWRKKFLSYIFQ